MPTDEVAHGAEADESRERTGPRHAAPRKPLFTRFHMPAGKAIAMAAMPTAVLMGMGFTSTLAVADNNPSTPSAKSLTIDEYKDCVAALEDSEDSKDKDESSASPTPSASASAGDSAEDGKDGNKGDGAEPTPSETSSADKSPSGTPSSPGSGSDDKAAPKPPATDPESKPGGSGAGDTVTPTPSESASRSGGLLETVGDTLGGILTGGKSDSEASPASEATPSDSATPSADGTKDAADSSPGSAGKDASDTAEDTTEKVPGAAEDTVKDTTDTASDAAEEAGTAAEEAADEATASPSPSESATTDPENCPVATDAVGGVDNTVLLADDPWFLDASSLTLKGADYKGIVEVRTANGTVKKVLKYVVSRGTDIGDLHQTVKDKQSGKTYHVQAARRSVSTITGGDTVMYTESISGNLFGLIPVTFSPDNPPPLNIPLIHFTKVHVVQAAQFGGNLHIPGMHVFTTG
ncbi:hypothetical protein [Streptomyces triticisoli]|uniref:hypothetical protein n=1 Tax=Streptomyces triticisoli TaxID=2182797 RepID=UPI000DD8F448|nr:hypothetical protein [Streptomyces triticisoli]